MVNNGNDYKVIGISDRKVMMPFRFSLLALSLHLGTKRSPFQTNSVLWQVRHLMLSIGQGKRAEKLLLMIREVIVRC